MGITVLCSRIEVENCFGQKDLISGSGAGQIDSSGWCVTSCFNSLFVFGSPHPFQSNAKKQFEGRKGSISGKYNKGQHLS